MPAVIDGFGDLDTLEAAEVWASLPRTASGRLDAETLLTLALRLAPPPAPLLTGAALDGDAGVLALLQRGREPWGTPASAVARIKDPAAFAKLCAACGVPHPEVRPTPPAGPRGWLVKQAGASGGGHVREAAAAVLGVGNYWQREVEGQPIGVSLVAYAGGGVVLGACRQEVEGAPDRPFAFAGLAGPVAAPPGLLAAAIRVCAAACVRGIASADAAVEADGRFHLLEVNPRPGAALELFEVLLGESLLPRHAAATSVRPHPVELPAGRAAALRLVRAAESGTVPEGVAWPEWAADRSAAGTPFADGDPLCTVLALGPTPDAAEALAVARAREIATVLGAGAPGRGAAEPL